MSANAVTVIAFLVACVVLAASGNPVLAGVALAAACWFAA